MSTIRVTIRLAPAEAASYKKTAKLAGFDNLQGWLKWLLRQQPQAK